MKSPAIQLLEQEVLVLRARVKQLERSNKDLFRVNDKLRGRLAKRERNENELNKVNI